MRLGLKSTVVVILLVAGALPLVPGLVIIEWLGHRYYQSSKGELFQTIAEEHAHGLLKTVSGEIAALYSWASMAGFPDEPHRPLPPAARETPEAYGERLDARWPLLPPGSPELEAVLDNPTAQRFRDFQIYHPLVVEIFLTDQQGWLLAASGKTSDFLQADEAWWQQTATLHPGQVLVSGIHRDESAGVYSLDISMPVFDLRQDPPQPRGVIKAVLNASPLLAAVPTGVQPGSPQRDIVIQDGRILERLSESRVATTDRQMPPEANSRLTEDQSGWFVGDVAGNAGQLIGFAPLDVTNERDHVQVVGNLTTVFVLVHDDLNAVLSPVRRQLLLLTLISGSTMLLFILLGLLIADVRIVHPLRLLQNVARDIAASAHLKLLPNAEADTTGAGPDVTTINPEILIKEAESIRSVEEIHHFAQDFALMARRVLNYHQQLESEIELKTEQIQRDLDLAREFQESLMPSAYPEIPSPSGANAARLSFSHIYKPALVVGGDFFDVLKLSDHCAGILVADVVGHGTRSALVTAVLRTLIEDSKPQADDPGAFLSEINRRFYDVMPHESELVFATLFYMTVDTRAHRLTFACAGHPSPFAVDRQTARVSSMVSPADRGPAVGIFNNVIYTTHARQITPGELFMLFTDGIVEACNPEDQEFGRDRLEQAILEHLQGDGAEITHDIMQEWHRFMGTAMVEDDICLVSVELLPPPAPAD